MLDNELLAYAIGVVKTNNTVTIMQLANELKINQYKASEILQSLVDLDFIAQFDGFVAVTDWAELN